MGRNVNKRRPVTAPKAVIFDLDDTIINSNRRLVWRKTIGRFEDRLRGHDVEEVVATISDAANAFWADAENNRRWGLNIPEGRRTMIGDVLERIGLRDAGLKEDLMKAFPEGRDDALALYPGAIDTLERLKASGIRLAMLTNGTSEMQRTKIDRFGLTAHFEYIQVQEEFGIGKPDPAAFHNILKALGVHAHEVWMVGDHLELDVAAARTIGIFGIWHDHAGAGLPADHAVRPDRIVTAIPELLTLAGMEL